MKHLNLKKTAAKGFSLVEMLVVIAVIGVIAAIAIPSISSINSSAQTATAQRNAQSVVEMYTGGAAAGITWTGATRNLKIASVVTGASPTSGAFSGKTFKVPNLATADQVSAYPYIGMDTTSGDLFYDKAGGQSAS